MSVNSIVVADVKLTWNSQAIKNMERRMIEGLFMMGTDIANRARVNAPVLTSALRNSIRVEEDGQVVYVRAGGSVRGHSIPYALRREYENIAHPDKRFYMKRAQESIMTGDYMTKYFGGVTK